MGQANIKSYGHNCCEKLPKETRDRRAIHLKEFQGQGGL